MAKTRVYELARELNVESKILLAEIEKLGIKVASHQSTLTSAQIDKIKANYSESKPTVVVRRRRKETPVSSQEAENFSHDDALSSREAETHHGVDYDATSVHGHEKSQIELQDEGEDQSSEHVALASREIIKESPQDIELVSLSVASELSEESEGEHKIRQEDEQSGEKEDSSFDATIAKDAHSHKNSPMPTVSSNAVSLKEEGMVTGDLSKDPLKLKKKTFTSATIVRRAPPEEAPAPQARKISPTSPANRSGGGYDDSRQRVYRREDSANQAPGVRRPNAPGSSPSSSSGSFSSSRPSFDRNQAPAKPPIFVTDEETFRATALKRESRKVVDKDWVAKNDEEEKLAKANALKKQKMLSARDLLDAALRGEDDVELFAPARKRTVYTPSGSSSAQKKRDLKKRKEVKAKGTLITTPRAAYRIVKMTGLAITVNELAKQLSIKVTDIIKRLMNQGMAVTINQEIDFETASIIASEYNFECKNIEKTEDDVLEFDDKNLFEDFPRPPIVTVMGHVDHGKTSILDVIRKTDVAAKEAGGITQHIGAYIIEKEGAKIAFLDTPGHEAFSSMRARGAQLTDIVVLVVAADDGVMPQTIEAIKHAKEAHVPIIVAVNKIDKPNINLDRIFTQLSEYGIQSEDWGGEHQFIKVSALKKTGIDELLDAIQLQAEILELKAPIACKAEGIVVEAHLDKGRGPIATVMTTKGVLRIGDFIVVGQVSGRVRAMTDHNGKSIKEAYPSTPVQVVGLMSVPMAGDRVNYVDDEKMAKELLEFRAQQNRKGATANAGATSLEDLLGKVASSEIPQISVIVKADTQGSVEALAGSLGKLVTSKVKAGIISKAVGAITEGDVNLAETSQAVIIGFNVRAPKLIEEMAEKRKVTIKYFSIIYEVIDAVKVLMATKLPPICTEIVQGHAEVRNLINVPKIGLIAGCSVSDGKVSRSSLLRLIRDSAVVHQGKVGSLRRFKDDVKEVQHGYECGISIDGYTDIRVGDVMEVYLIEEKAAVLDI